MITGSSASSLLTAQDDENLETHESENTKKVGTLKTFVTMKKL